MAECAKQDSEGCCNFVDDVCSFVPGRFDLAPGAATAAAACKRVKESTAHDTARPHLG